MGMEGSNHACAPGRVSPLPLRLLPAGRLVFGLMLGYLASSETHGALAKLPTYAFCYPVRAPCEASDKNQALSSSQRSCFCSCSYPTVRRSYRGASRSSLRMSATRGGNLADEDFKGEFFSKWWQDSREEMETPRKLDTMGSFPAFLDGVLLRNGPGAWRGKSRSYTHAFDGLAKLTKFQVREGEVWYSAKFLRSQWHNRMVELGQDMPASISVGPTDPPLSQLEKVLALFNSDSFDNTPVNVHQLGGQLGPWVAVTDAPVAMEFDVETLETRGRVDKRYRNAVTQLGGMLLFSTAHPLPCPETGGSINYFLELNVLGGNRALIVRTDDKLGRKVVGSVGLGAGEIPYVHSFGLTQTGKGSFMPSLEWCGRGGAGGGDRTRIFVFDLKSAQEEPSWTYEADPLFFYHAINAYEEEGGITVDLCGYPSPDIATSPNAFAYIPNMKDGKERSKQARDGSLYRIRLPLEQQGHVPVQRLKTLCQGTEMTFELPTISPVYAGKKHQHVYGYTGFARGDKSDFTDWAVLKISTDEDGRTRVSKWEEEFAYPSEPIFVPRPDGEEEDDGVVLVQMFDGRREESFLLCLDAKSMIEVARAYTGQRSSPQFHGQFVWQSR